MEDYIDDVIAILDEMSRSLRAMAVVNFARWIADSPAVAKEYGEDIATLVGDAIRPIRADVAAHMTDGE